MGDSTVEGGNIRDPFMPAKSTQVGWNTTGSPFINERQCWDFHYVKTRNKTFINFNPYKPILLSHKYSSLRNSDCFSAMYILTPLFPCA